jgi:autotransporter-associated beta strand protein
MKQDKRIPMSDYSFAPRKGTARPTAAVGLQPLESRVLCAVHTWTGAVDNNWSTPGNWAGGAPASNEVGGTHVVFNTTDATVIQNIANLTVDSIAFNAGSQVTLTLQQNLKLRGAGTAGAAAIKDNVGGNAIAGVGDLVLTGASAAAVDVAAAAGTLTIAADVVGDSTAGVIKAGAGTLRLQGANGYTGGTTVRHGTLMLSGAGGANKTLGPGELVLGDNAGAWGSAVVRLSAAGGQIPDGVNVRVNSDGRLDTNGWDETVHILTMTGGHVQTHAAGSLTLTGDLYTYASSSIALIEGKLTLAGAAPKLTVADGAAPVDLEVMGVLGGANGFVKEGAGSLRLSGLASNTLAGEVRVATGRVELAKTSGVAIAGRLTVGDGGLDPDTVVLLGDEQIADAALVEVESHGTLDLNGNAERVAAVTASGDVGLGSGGELTVGGVDTASLIGGDVTGSGTLRLTGGGILYADSDLNLPNVAVVASGPESVAYFQGGHNRFASITVADRARLHLMTYGGFGLSSATRTAALSVTGGATLDVGLAALIVDYAPGAPSPVEDVKTLVKAGYAGGAWDGAGITSLFVAQMESSLVTLGFDEASAILGAAGGEFAGEAVDASAVLLRFALKGDADLDADVDFEDLVRVAQHYDVASGMTWGRGDFDGDGAVTFTDLVPLAQLYDHGFFGPAAPAVERVWSASPGGESSEVAKSDNRTNAAARTTKQGSLKPAPGTPPFAAARRIHPRHLP